MVCPSGGPVAAEAILIKLFVRGRCSCQCTINDQLWPTIHCSYSKCEEHMHSLYKTSYNKIIKLDSVRLNFGSRDHSAII